MMMPHHDNSDIFWHANQRLLPSQFFSVLFYSDSTSIDYETIYNSIIYYIFYAINTKFLQVCSDILLELPNYNILSVFQFLKKIVVDIEILSFIVKTHSS